MVGGMGRGMFGYSEVHSITKALFIYLFIKYVSFIGALAHFAIH